MPDLLPSPTATIHAPAFRAHDNFRSEVDTSNNFHSEVDTNNGSNGPNGSKGAAVSHAAANDENAAPPKPTFGARKSLCNWNYCASNDEVCFHEYVGDIISDSGYCNHEYVEGSHIGFGI